MFNKYQVQILVKLILILALMIDWEGMDNLLKQSRNLI